MLFQTTLLTLASCTFASALHLEHNRQAACPNVHVFGARETTVSPGFGTAGVVVNLVLNSNPGSTAEAIVYPACGGQASCGGQSYAQSAVAGTAAVAAAVNAFNARCPNTKLVLVGYSQVWMTSLRNVCSMLIVNREAKSWIMRFVVEETPISDSPILLSQSMQLH